jgi:hypothetical protein
MVEKMREMALAMPHGDAGTAEAKAKSEAFSAVDREEQRIEIISKYQPEIIGALSAVFPLVLVDLWTLSREATYQDFTQRVRESINHVSSGGRLLTPENYLSKFTKPLNWFPPAATNILGVATEFNASLKRAVEHFLTPGVDLVSNAATFAASLPTNSLLPIGAASSYH